MGELGMLDGSSVGRMGVLGTVFLLSVPLLPHAAWAAKTTAHSGPSHTSASRFERHAAFETARPIAHVFGRSSLPVVLGNATVRNGGFKNAVYWSRKGRKGPMHYASASINYGGVSCVPYARDVSGIDLKGNAFTWWDEAAGVYARGNDPEPGSVLNFRSHATMRLGHVAVVSAIVSGREIEVSHANWWGPGATKSGVNRNVSVIDVSPNNDWTAVRVSLGRPGEYGSIYPTYGFIYARRDDGLSATRVASHVSRPSDEIAEAPDGKSVEMTVRGWTLDAPDRRLK
jgi:surface antigen